MKIKKSLLYLVTNFLRKVRLKAMDHCPTICVYVRNLGVIIDSEIHLDQKVNSVLKISFFSVKETVQTE